MSDNDFLDHAVIAIAAALVSNATNGFEVNSEAVAKKAYEIAVALVKYNETTT